jgi:hypothetical protein
VNWVAVVVAAIAQMVLGFIWYGPLFGKRWMSLMGVNPPSKPPEGMWKTYAWSALGSLVTAAVLDRLVATMGASTAGAGIVAGFWVWLGFVATVTLASVLYERRSINLYVLNNGYQLVSLAVMGAVLAAWP